MKKTNTLFGFSVFILLIGLCFGYIFLTKKQERKYTEILVNLNQGSDTTPVEAVAKRYGFKMKPHKYVVKASAFTRKNRIYSIYKYDIDPENQNRVVAALKALKAKAGIINTVEPNFLVSSFSNDPLFSKQWNLQRLEIEKLWARGNGQGVTVAVIDTGVSSNLKDLDKSRLVKGYNFIDRNKNFEDDHGHGSHVAGTIGQDTNNKIGVAGIAYKAKIMPLKVLGKNGSGTTLNIAEAIVYAADNGANIINLSLGGGMYTKVLKDACDYAVKKGVTIIAAAGNESDGSSAYPARYGSCISVAAADKNEMLAPYSNYGEGVDIIAPGGNMSTLPSDGILQNAPSLLGEGYPHEVDSKGYFYYFQGTSMATPHVAGIAAILHQIGVREPAKLRSLLLSTAGKDIQGIPYVNPVGAIEHYTKSRNIPERPKSSPVFKDGEDPYFLNAGAVSTSTVSSSLILLIAIFGLLLFDRIRRKHMTIGNIYSPLLFVGLLMGATGFAFLGFLQDKFPFTILPERFSGLLFSSVLDYDRVLFFLTKPSLFWHNLLVPVLFMVLLNFSNEKKRRFTVGLLLGFSAKLIGEGIFLREITVLPDGVFASIFLIVNGLVVFLFPFIMARNE